MALDMSKFDEQGGELAAVPTNSKSGLAKRSSGKLKSRKTKEVQGASVDGEAKVSEAIAVAGNALSDQSEMLEQLKEFVAQKKIEMIRALPDMIDARVQEILKDNPIDVDAGARRVREAVMSPACQEMLAEMGLELTYE